MCRAERRVIHLAFVALIAVTLWAPAAPAGIVALFRDSSLSASGRTSLDEFLLSDQSAAFGPYDNSIGRSIPAAGGGTTRAAASQRSELDPLTGIGSARGDASAHLAELDAIAARGSSFFSFGFDVTDDGQPTALEIEGHAEASFDATSRVTLRADGSDAPLFERVIGPGDSGRLDFDADVPLAPGRYILAAEAVANGTPVPTAAGFDARFAPATPIPLPPAAWTGAVGILVAMRYVRRREATRGSGANRRSD